MRDNREPVYDDVTLALIEEQKTAELVKALVEYAKTLENMVVELRKWVNALTPPGKSEPFPDLHGDIYEVFYDYPAYQRFKKLFGILE
ncbi:MAG: hypothetical protein AB1767_03020 [Bacillota bacterium]